ncbi:hypothetical protein ACJIZ3_013927 [Penstemon smallii]|uniref:Cyclin-like domain-containing protein n=1 Tax=Penstemon smallii TaxID=265156 RepID=A0ABD3RI78_9LAMI
MSLARSYQPRGSHCRRDGMLSYARNSNMVLKEAAAAVGPNYNHNYDSHPYNANFGTRKHDSSNVFSQNFVLDRPNYDNVWHDTVNSSKRRKLTDLSCENSAISYQQQSTYENHVGLSEHLPYKYFNAYCSALFDCNNNSTVVTATTADDAGAYAPTAAKRDRSTFEDDEVVFMSRDEIDRCSPSRKDGIDVLHETHLRYSYCSFLQNLGVRLDLPQTTIGTAMVLCHRFFVHRSHASHDRFLIATAALFLASKSEETARPLNDVLRVSCEIVHKQDFTLLSYMFPIDWFELYRERITEAEQLILTTLNFELNVKHPYESLTSTLQKLGFTEPVLVDLALNLVSEGLRSSLWLQFKPHQIAAGAAYLAGKFLNMNLASCHNVWHEFHTSPSVLKGK